MKQLTAFFAAFLSASALAAEEATFYRAVNLNGPALTIDGRTWEAGTAAREFKASGNSFENQKVPLRPPAEADLSRMIRSSLYGNSAAVELTGVPPGDYQILLYVWEDNQEEQFDLLVNGGVVLPKFHSGSAGMWKKLGPWPARSQAGKLTVSARGAGRGAANLSGLEVWAGPGVIPGLEGTTFAGTPTPEQTAFFESRIRPVLADNCYECHSARAEKLKGGLLLDSRAGVRKGGDTGRAVTPGDPDGSLLIQALRHSNADLTMPPDKHLPPEQIADLEQWIHMGAPDPRTEDTVATVKARNQFDWKKAREWWSFQPLSSPPPPSVKDQAWPAGDIDRFILAKLEEAGLPPVPDAGKRALIRRASYDLTGLPPSPEEVAAFLADDSPAAFARLVDRLLDSPRYGERWGRHWLDLVRYADTAGDNSDYPVPQMRRYRDWVIAAFNRDLPYDEFVRDQLAGDLRGGASDEERYDRITATGYIANARRFGSRVDDYPQHLTIEDTIDNVGRAFLGLSVSCARCHDHKFDPVTADDYYALYGIFNSTRYPWPGIELDKNPRGFVPLVPPDKLSDAETAKKAREKEQARLDKEVNRLRESLKKAPEPEKKNVAAQIRNAEKAASDYQKIGQPFVLAYAVAEGAEIADAAIQQKGDPAKPGPVVRRHFLTVLGGAELPADFEESGRVQLADWIMARENPLPARVMVNRLWLHHFGRGLVPTPNDFGKQGKPATHPELLDWLAAKFRDGGWSVKAMHRLILLSRTWQLSTLRDASALARDPANDWLSSYPRRRLDAEAIRDTLLALGENLDLSPAGDHPFPPAASWNFTQHNPFKAVYESNRRSVFLMTQRIQRHPYLAIFDGADPSSSTPIRSTSTTPLQALYLLNDPFVHDQSSRVAARLTAREPGDANRLRYAWELLFSRPPEADELAAAEHFLADARTRLRQAKLPPDKAESEAWRASVRVLVRTNEFVYLD